MRRAPAPAGRSLEEFAAARPSKRGRPCWACSIPERKDVDKTRAPGQRQITVRRIVDWLTAPSPEGRGYSTEEATMGRINSHFANRHHVTAPSGVRKPGAA